MPIHLSAAIRGTRGDVLRPRSSRDTWSLVLVKEGRAFCSVDRDEYMLSAGHILVIAPTVEYGILPTEDYEQIQVEMTEPLIPGREAFFCLHDDADKTAASLLWMIHRQLLRKPENYENVVQYLAAALRQLLIPMAGQSCHTEVLKLEQLLRRNIGNPDFQITDALEQIPQTPSYTRRLFRQSYGCSPGVYLNNLRIGAAKVILMSQSLPITEVAAQCGFSDPKYFARRFRQATGHTPSEFQQHQPSSAPD